MNLVPRLLERVRTLLFGLPESGRAIPGATSETRHSLPALCPSPLLWGAILARARRRRAPHLWPPVERPVLGDTGALVRTYVLPEAERTRVLASSSSSARRAR